MCCAQTAARQGEARKIDGGNNQNIGVINDQKAISNRPEIIEKSIRNRSEIDKKRQKSRKSAKERPGRAQRREIDPKVSFFGSPRDPKTDQKSIKNGTENRYFFRLRAGGDF